MSSRTRVVDAGARRAEPARAHDVEDWRGVAAEHATSIRTRGNAVPAEAQPGAARRPAPAVPAGCVWLLIAVVRDRERGPAQPSRGWSQRGIDLGMPPLLAGGSAPGAATRSSALMLAAVVRAVASAGSSSCASPAGSGRRCCWSCGAGCSRTSSGSTSRFHDRYTTGRVVSRLTSDIDAIMELLAGGFDGLVTAVLTMVGVGVLLLTPRLRARRGLPDLLPAAGAAGALVLARPRRGPTAGCGRPPPWSSCSSSRR